MENPFYICQEFSTIVNGMDYRTLETYDIRNLNSVAVARIIPAETDFSKIQVIISLLTLCRGEAGVIHPLLKYLYLNSN